MSPAEVLGHVRKKVFQFSDARRERDWSGVPLKATGTFPSPPAPEHAPDAVRRSLQLEADRLLAGHWRAFGSLDLPVDDPPHWHRDYRAGHDVATQVSAFKLNHRALPAGADIKLVWELSRWQPLVRLAQAAHVQADARAGEKCVVWLEDWVKHNPPYRGWNWTSALEAGLRLIQFAWMDALLSARTEAWGMDAEWDTLRYEILPPHVWHVWRHQSFGSSANNHLLGELAGLIVATARWPALTHWGAPLEALQRRWEQEVVAQFAPDGGNREQALNYQLFSWECCWQARLALRAAGRPVAEAVERRLVAAARFYWEVQASHDPWDYGDSDNATVTPFYEQDKTAVQEWHSWLGNRPAGRGIAYWIGEPPAMDPPLGTGAPRKTQAVGDWWVYPKSGLAICESGLWWLRWDLSPLGYLRMAAHGHLDALHLSVWRKRVALVVDPGTGAYFGDLPLRQWLASRAAHNGPCPAGEEYPPRRGPFLWAEPHEQPTWKQAPAGAGGSSAVLGELHTPQGCLRRTVVRIENGDGWRVADEVITPQGHSAAFTVRWQFAPGSRVQRLGERRFSVHRAEVSLVMLVDANWAEVDLVETAGAAAAVPEAAGRKNDYEGIVSPAFRQTQWAPYLKLAARAGEKPCIFQTTFLASPPA